MLLKQLKILWDTSKKKKENENLKNFDTEIFVAVRNFKKLLEDGENLLRSCIARMNRRKITKYNL